MKYLTSWWERFLFGIEVENIARTEKWLDDFDKARAERQLPPPPPDWLIMKGM